MKIKLADLIIQTNNESDKLYTFFDNYVCEGSADIVVEIEKEDIDYEKNKSEYKGISDFEYYLLALYRKIAEQLPNYDAFVFHGSAVYFNETASILTGLSGAGKSTHASLLSQYKDIKIINDDKPIIRIIDNLPYVYGTPWDGKHHISENTSKPLKNLIFVNKAKENKIVEINKDNSFVKVLEQTYRPIKEKQAIIKTINLVNQLVKVTSQYNLYCDISKKASDVSFEVIK